MQIIYFAAAISLGGILAAPTGVQAISETQSTSTPAAWQCNRGYVALTYDDGPHSVHTPKLLRELKKYGLRATFFVTGENVDRYPKIVRDIAADGHAIANHTWNHPDLTKRSQAQIFWQIDRTNKAIKSITGQSPKFFRPPYGATNSRVNKIAQNLGLTQTGWTVDTMDWSHRSTKKTAAAVKSANAGDNVLMHDIVESTPGAVPAIARILKSKKLCAGQLVQSKNSVSGPGWRYYAKPGRW